MIVELIPVSKLVPDPSNARKHDKKNISAIKGSLKQFGQQKPLVIDEKNVVIAGNGTLEAAKLLGWTEIECVRSSLNGLAASAYALADNRSGELASWNEAILGSTLHSLRELEYDLPDIGFDTSILDSLYTPPQHVGDDLQDFIEPSSPMQSSPASQENKPTYNDSYKAEGQNPYKEWEAMPEYVQEDAMGVRKIIIHFKTEDDVKIFSALVEQQITDKTRFIWFPKAEIANVVDKRYISEDYS